MSGSLQKTGRRITLYQNGGSVMYFVWLWLLIADSVIPSDHRYYEYEERTALFRLFKFLILQSPVIIALSNIFFLVFKNLAIQFIRHAID